MSIGLDLDWTRSGLCQILLNLDWIRAVNHFKIYDSERIWTEFMQKKYGIFVVKKLHFSNILDFIWNWTLHLKKFLYCGWTNGFGLSFKESGLDLE